MSILIAIALIIILSYSLRNYLRVAFTALRVPGPFAYPIIGNCNFAKQSKSKIFKKKPYKNLFPIF
jgi:hypothetical protein